jgi:hypothetical protein
MREKWFLEGRLMGGSQKADLMDDAGWSGGVMELCDGWQMAMAEGG